VLERYGCPFDLFSLYPPPFFDMLHSIYCVPISTVGEFRLGKHVSLIKPESHYALLRGKKVQCCCHCPIGLPSDLVRHLLHVAPTTNQPYTGKKNYMLNTKVTGLGTVFAEKRLINQCCIEAQNCWRFTFSPSHNFM
jgi:hypothetical protein